MSEKKLKNRKRIFTKGKAIRVSDFVYATLNKGRGRTSWDCWLRKLHGLPDRDGLGQRLIEGMLEITSGVFILKLDGTSWSELEETTWKLAYKAAAKKKTRVEAPIRMRELAK